jgi:hypothetical protein
MSAARSVGTDDGAAHPLLADLARCALQRGTGLAERAFEGGLAVTQADGTVRPIPIGAIPVILSDEEVRRRRELAMHLTHATAKAARWRLAGPGRHAVLDALGPAEQRLVRATWDGPSDLAVARVDFLGAPALAALEINATIPAMQGYSDIAAAAWLATFAGDCHDLPALLRANGSNAMALQQALVELYALHRGDELSSVGLLCRRGDAQLTELRYLRDRFSAAGLEVHLVHPDELSEREGRLLYAGRPLQLLYRLLFLSRLDAGLTSALEAVLSKPRARGTLVLNRPAPHLEMKSTLAWLSTAGESGDVARAMDLTEPEQAAIRASVPWTRSLIEAGSPAERDDWIALLKQRPDDFVLKRAWSYGGNDVFVGRARDTAAFWSRVHATYPHVDRWVDLVDLASEDARGGGFVVQRAVARTTSGQVLCTPTRAHTAEVVTDYAAYASIGTSPAWGGVCRAAASDVVNIVGGGAVVPVIRKAVADTVWLRRAESPN